MGEVRNFLILSFLAICLLNITLIGAYLVFTQYGSVTLSPGENYTLNIPFKESSEVLTQIIHGKAQTTSGKSLQGINISVYYDNELISKNTTDSNGNYYLYLPEINSNRKYNISIQYNNKTPNGKEIQLASNDYTLDFENNLKFSRSSDKYVILQGTIENKDARIENGRFEINLQYWPSNQDERYEIFDYEKYSININPEESYKVPNNEINVSWKIPSDAKLGRYKFYIKTSFNAKEKTKDIYFNITS